jgi:hypothetical protein
MRSEAGGAGQVTQLRYRASVYRSSGTMEDGFGRMTRDSENAWDRTGRTKPDAMIAVISTEIGRPYRRIIFMQKCEWMPPKLTNEIIDAAIEGFEQQKRRIDEQISELRAARSGSPAQSASPPAKQPRRRRISAAGRKAIAEAQRKRWAASKGEDEPKAAKPAKKVKGRLSAEGRANIVAALKKRWAAKKAASKK